MEDTKLKRALLFIYDRAYLAMLRLKDDYNMLRLGVPQIMTMDETMDYIIDNRCSIGRYGDGELKLASGEEISFQKKNEQMEKSLCDILKSRDSGFLVCAPDYFTHAKWMKKDSQRFMWMRVAQYRKNWTPLFDLKKSYGNASITRCYYDWQDRTNAGRWFLKLKKIWDGKDIVFVEGRYSRLGVGNDLFDNVASIRRILCPERDAFESYHEILAEASKLEKSCMILIALGPTATILSYDLHRLGFQALDIGHVDIEYEWFLQKAESKVKVPGKYVNEARDGKNVEEIYNEDYKQQVIVEIITHNREK